MNDLHEAVELPDPATHPFVHPVDLPEARDLFVRGWWFARACSPPVMAALAALVWALGGSLFGVIIAPVSVFVIGLIASRWFTTRAWDYVPRRRQDTRRSPWSAWAATIDAVALVVVGLAVVLAQSTHPFPDPVLAYAIGSGVGVAVIQLIELIGALISRRATWTRPVLLLGVAAAVGLVALFGPEARWGGPLLLPAALGFATIVLAQSGWWASNALRPRRDNRDDETA